MNRLFMLFNIKQGDSGGPIYVNHVQVGITSYGVKCEARVVYTLVSAYTRWIHNVTHNFIHSI